MTGLRAFANPTASRRRLAVAFLDVVGFSRLMADDEAGTFARWNELRMVLVLPQLRRHGGTLVKSMGDGLLVTFAEPLAAVRWAQCVQAAGRRSRRRLAVRIAIHVADVLVGDGDVAGDGVNVVAHLQQRAAPGGILLTEAAMRAVADDAGLVFRPLGPVALKHGERAVAVFDLVTEGTTVPRLDPASGASGRPIVAVLPFRAGSIADMAAATALTDDLRAALGGRGELTVLAGGVTAAFVGRDVDPRSVGRALDVDYVITGSLRWSRGHLRAGIELDDAASGVCTATGLHTVGGTDALTAAEGLAERLAAWSVSQVRAAALRRARTRREPCRSAYEHCVLGLAALERLDRSGFEDGRRSLARAAALDATFAMPLAWEARALLLAVDQGWVPDVDTALAEARYLARAAVLHEPTNPLALATLGHLRAALDGDDDDALDHHARARAASPGCPEAWLLASATHALLGQGEIARTEANRAIGLAPFGPYGFLYRHQAGLADYVAGDLVGCLGWCRRAAAEGPGYVPNLRLMAAAMVGLGCTDAARGVGDRLRRSAPGPGLAHSARTTMPFRDPQANAAMAERLRMAGVPT